MLQIGRIAAVRQEQRLAFAAADAGMIEVDMDHRLARLAGRSCSAIEKGPRRCIAGT